MKTRWSTLLLVGTMLGCDASPESSAPGDTSPGGKADDAEGEVELLEVYDVDALNAGLDPALPTADVAFYLTEGGRMGWDSMVTGIERARETYAAVGVQLRVVWAGNLDVPEDWQTLDATLITEPSTGPEVQESNLYRHLEEEFGELTPRTTGIFESMTAVLPAEDLGLDRTRVVHILDLKSVPLSFFEWVEGAWELDTVSTAGLSFPPYMHGERIPKHLRGVITMSSTSALAHELGHKMINVSHEGVDVCPQFATYGPDLMLYGSGDRIPGGEEGRWQQERLHLSPFIYTLGGKGKRYNPDFEAGGAYDDPIYGEYVVDPVCD